MRRPDARLEDVKVVLCECDASMHERASTGYPQMGPYRIGRSDTYKAGRRGERWIDGMPGAERLAKHVAGRQRVT